VEAKKALADWSYEKLEYELPSDYFIQTWISFCWGGEWDYNE